MAQKSGYEKRSFLSRLFRALFVLLFAVTFDYGFAHFYAERHEANGSFNLKEIPHGSRICSQGDCTSPIATENQQGTVTTKTIPRFANRES